MNSRRIAELLRRLQRRWPEWIGTEIGEIVPILDERDGPPFDTEWIVRFEQIEAEKRANPLPTDVTTAIAELRESAFLLAIQRWSSHDVAACVSDDMGLLGDALALDSYDPWINGLLRAYANGRLPNGEIVVVEGRLRDVAESALE